MSSGQTPHQDKGSGELQLPTLFSQRLAYVRPRPEVKPAYGELDVLAILTVVVQERSPILESGSVVMFPLSVDELALWLADPVALERHLGVRLAMGRPNRLMSAVFERKIEKLRAAPSDRLWATYWAIVVNDRDLVGLVGFKGRCREEAEVGYGIEPQYRGRGIMKTALRLMVEWAESEPCVSRITARTDSANEASIRVLRACDFAFAGRRGQEILWVRSV